MQIVAVFPKQITHRIGDGCVREAGLHVVRGEVANERLVLQLLKQLVDAVVLALLPPKLVFDSGGK
jgi:hypothetical protein